MLYMPNNPAQSVQDHKPADSQFLAALARQSPFFARFFGLTTPDDPMARKLQQRRQRRRGMKDTLRRAELAVSQEKVDTGTAYGAIPKSAVQRMADDLLLSARGHEQAAPKPAAKPAGRDPDGRLGDVISDALVDAGVAHGLFGPLAPLVQFAQQVQNVQQMAQDLELFEYEHPRRPGQRFARTATMQRAAGESLHSAARRTRADDMRREMEEMSLRRKRRPEHEMRLVA